VALPKGDRQKWLVEKLTELGATMLVPLVTRRGVAQPSSGAIERLGRSVIEAAKQCGRNRLMRIAEPKNWGTYIPDCSTEEHRSARRLVAHPGGTAINEINLREPQKTFLAIGPEGGLTEAEVAMTKAADWQVISLGPRILRVETAAITLAGRLSLTSGR
jgi:16S rRNA (uracil1498-N3)-methyltransferase